MCRFITYCGSRTIRILKCNSIPSIFLLKLNTISAPLLPSLFSHRIRQDGSAVSIFPKNMYLMKVYPVFSGVLLFSPLSLLHYIGAMLT